MTEVNSMDNSQYIETFTSGGLLIPRVSDSLSLRLYISNLSQQAESFSFQLNRFTDTVKIPLVSGSTAVPGEGAFTFEFDPAALGLAGNIVEAVVELPLIEPPGSFQLQPSLNLLQGGNNGPALPLAIVTVGDFGYVRENEVQMAASQRQQNRLQDVPSNLYPLTWGLVDIPAVEEGVQTEVSLWLSSLSNEEEEAVITVNSLNRGTTKKRQVLNRSVIVPAGQAEELRIEGVDGSAVEVIVEVPFAAPPLTVLPLLTPSFVVNRREIDTGTTNLVILLTPGQALFAD